MTLSIGTRLGPYELRAWVGTGGMGEVFRALDTRLGREVAVKVLSGELEDDSRLRDRFKIEARAASSLSHPNIAHLYDVGEEAGRPFLVMELVEGKTLDDGSRRGPINPEQAARIAVAVAGALEAAHARGIIHRDIKSANIIVTPEGNVKVLDFGVARVSADAEARGSSGDTILSTVAGTQIGALVGTVPYMSPEQALARELDARTDLFSLGVVLYEILTGHRPFRGETPFETIDRICHAAPEPMSTRNGDVPRVLEQIVNRCLEKNRDDRYPSAKLLRVELENYLAGGDPDRGAEAIPAVSGTDAMQIDSLAVLPFTTESPDPEIGFLCDGLTESLINELSRDPSLRVISRNSAFACRDAGLDPRGVGERLGVGAVILGRLTQRGDKLSLSAELVDTGDERQLWGARINRPATDLLDLEEELADQFASKLRVRLGGETRAADRLRGTESTEAYRLYLKGRHFMEGTAEEMEGALKSFQDAVVEDPKFAKAWTSLATMHVLRAIHGTVRTAEAAVGARAANERALALDPECAEAHITAGSIHFYFDWDWPAAHRAFRRGIELAPGNSQAHMDFALCLVASGQYDLAIEQADLALELDPLAKMPMHHAGWARLAAQRFEEAVACFQAALDVYPEWVWGNVKKGIALAFAGRPEGALAAAARAEELIEKGGFTPLLFSWLGVLYARVGQPERARSIVAQLEARALEHPVEPTDPAIIYIALGDREASFRWLEKGLQERSPMMLLIPHLFFFDGIREDPQFERLVREIGLTV